MYRIEPIPDGNPISVLKDIVDMSTVIESVRLWTTADAMFMAICGTKFDDRALRKKFPSAVRTDEATDVKDWHETVEWHRRCAVSLPAPAQKTLWSHLRLFDPDQPCVSEKPQRRNRKKA